MKTKTNPKDLLAAAIRNIALYFMRKWKKENPGNDNFLRTAESCRKSLLKYFWLIVAAVVATIVASVITVSGLKEGPNLSFQKVGIISLVDTFVVMSGLLIWKLRPGLTVLKVGWIWYWTRRKVTKLGIVACIANHTKTIRFFHTGTSILTHEQILSAIDALLFETARKMHEEAAEFGEDSRQKIAVETRFYAIYDYFESQLGVKILKSADDYLAKPTVMDIHP